MPVPPPWFVRVLPGIGVAVTVAYVGYELYKHHNNVNAQQRVYAATTTGEEEESIPLHNINTNRNNITGGDADDDELSRLCAWLKLPPNALDCVPSDRLNVCLVLLQQFIPVPARPAFLAVYCDKLQTEQDVELLSLLLESMEEDTTTTTTTTTNQNDNENENENNEDSAAVATAKEQIVVLMKQTEQPIQVLLHTIEVCPVEQRPILLNRMYMLWNVNQLDSFLMLLPHHDPARLFPIVEALCCEINTATTNSSGVGEESTTVAVWIILFVELLTRLHNDPDRLSGLLRALRICPVHTRDILLHKLASVSMDRLQQVTLCCFRFADAQVRSMVDTLVATSSSSSPPPPSLVAAQLQRATTSTRQSFCSSSSSTGTSSSVSSMMEDDEAESYVFSQN